jgi:hypothetical protein
LLSSTIVVGVLLILLQQIAACMERVVSVRSAKELLIGCLVCGLIVCVLWCIAILSKVGTERRVVTRRSLLLWTVLGVVCAFRVIWVLTRTGGLSADYREYFELGARIASGSLLQGWDTTYVNLPVLAERAACYTAPLFRFIGPSLVGLRLFNVALQILTSWIIFRFLSESGAGQHRHIAILAACAVIVFPEFWFSAATACHDIPGYFWLTICLYGLWRLLYRNTGSGGTAFTVDGTSLVVALWLGVALAILELQRGFGKMVVIAAGTAILVPVISRELRSSKLQRPFLSSCLLLVLTLGVFGVSQSLLSRAIRSDFGSTSYQRSLLSYISAVGSEGGSSCYDMFPWSDHYMEAVPVTYRTDYALRKLAHEKLLQPRMFLGSLVRKNATFSLCTMMMEDAEGRLSSAGERTIDKIPWYSTKTVICNLLQTVFLCVLVLRIMLVRRFGLSSVEGVVFCYSLVQGGLLMLVTETASTYDEFLFLPAVVSLYTLASNWIPHTGTLGADVNLRPFHLELITVLFQGMLGLAITCTSYMAVSALAGQRNAGFLSVESHSSAGAFTAEFKDGRHIHAAVTLELAPDSSEKFASADFRVFVPVDAEYIGFLVTGNQRAESKNNWWAPSLAPMNYRVAFGGSVVAEGDVKGLRVPLFVKMLTRDLRRSADGTIAGVLYIEADSTGARQEKMDSESLAVECFSVLTRRARL